MSRLSPPQLPSPALVLRAPCVPRSRWRGTVGTAMAVAHRSPSAAGTHAPASQTSPGTHSSSVSLTRPQRSPTTTSPSQAGSRGGRQSPSAEQLDPSGQAPASQRGWQAPAAQACVAGQSAGPRQARQVASTPSQSAVAAPALQSPSSARAT
ncbi:MAG: hypothetical protein CMN31_27575 [Sandaracinus sp.]|nr:hypothetical protein [Myxococcales bacterium]MAT26015.1 hypothetical protein [Sandaracinus sp.]MBJ75050.1 hypothetical protein [Sandaracinus sp.]